MGILDELQDRYGEAIEEKMHEYASMLPYEQLKVPIEAFLHRGGKRFRPILCLLSCELVGGSVEEALPAAVAIELLHNFSLIHDDIEDRSPIRRGNLAIHLLPGDPMRSLTCCPYCGSVIKMKEAIKELVEEIDIIEPYGLAHAINAGDALLILSLIAAHDTHSLVSEERANRTMRNILFGILSVCCGQGIDIDSHEKRFRKDELDEKDFFELLRLKTGMLISSGCEAGAIIGGGSDEQIEAIREFAEKISIAFQIQDDILNITGGKEYGKEIGGDIDEGKRTLMVIHACREATRDEARRLLEILDKENDYEERSEAISLLKKYESIGYARNRAKGFLIEAKECLDVFPDMKIRGDLIDLADFLVQRRI
jgi:geranylgeranyl diphosphate synthase type I